MKKTKKISINSIIIFCITAFLLLMVMYFLYVLFEQSVISQLLDSDNPLSHRLQYFDDIFIAPVSLLTMILIFLTFYKQNEQYRKEKFRSNLLSLITNYKGIVDSIV